MSMRKLQTDMFSLLSPLVGGLASGSIKGVVKRTKIQAVCWVMIAGAGFFAVVFACLLSYLWIGEFVSPVMSATILLGFWLAVALIALIAMKILSVRQRNRRKQEMAQERTKLLVNSALAAGTAAFRMNRKFTLATVVPLIGIALLAFLDNSEKLHDDE